MLVAVNALGATGGHCDSSAGFAPNIFGRETGITDGVINGPDQARLAVRYNIKYGADVIKTCATGGVLSLTRRRRYAAAHAGRTRRPGGRGACPAPQDRRPCPRRQRRQDRAIRAGIDSIEHGSFLDDEALDMMKARGTYYVPTLMAAEGLKERLTRWLPAAGGRREGPRRLSPHSTPRCARRSRRGVKVVGRHGRRRSIRTAAMRRSFICW